MRTFNLKLILWLAGTFLITAIAVHFTHSYQVRKNAEGYLELATTQEALARDEQRKVEERGKALESARNNYRRYLALRPYDFQARAKYGRLLIELPIEPVIDLGRAFFQFERVLRDIPSSADSAEKQKANDELEDEVLKLQVDLAADRAMARYADAADYLERLMAKADARGEKQEVLHGMTERLADLKVAVGETDRALEMLTDLVDPENKKGDPHRISAHRRRIELWSREGDPNKARAATELMLKLNPKNPDALLADAEFWLNDLAIDNDPNSTRQKKVARAWAECSKALELRPDDPDGLALAAQILSSDYMPSGPEGQLGPDLARAREYLVKSVTLKPGVARRYDQLANLESRLHEMDGDPVGGMMAAMAVYKQGVDAVNELAKAKAGVLNPKETIQLRYRWVETLIAKEATETGLTEEEKATLDTMLAELHTQLGEQPVVAFLDAYRHVAHKEWQKARSTLEKLQADFTAGQAGADQLLPKVRQLLALCYGRLGNDDLKVAAYRAIVEQDQGNPAAVRLYAEALLSVGRVEEGLAYYDRWRGMVGANADLDRRYFNLRFAAANRLPRLGSQRLDALHILRDTLAKYAKSPEAASDPWPVLIGIDIDIAVNRAAINTDTPIPDNALGVDQDTLDRIKDRLQNARAPESPLRTSLPIWITSVELLQRLEDPAADAVWKELEELFHDTYDVRMAKARYLINAKREAALPELAALTENLPAGVTDEELAEMYSVFGRLCVSVKQSAEGLKYLLKSVDLRPGQLQIRNTALQVAQQALDVGTANRLADEIQQIAPDSDDAHYAKAVTYLTKYMADEGVTEGSGSKEDLEQAKVELRDALKVRKEWALPHILLGSINKELDDVEGMAKEYQKALNLGANEPSLVVVVVDWLTRRGRITEADQLIQKIEAAGAGESSLVAVAASAVAAEMEDYDLAIERRQMAISGGMTTAQQYLALAYLYKVQGSWDKTVENLNMAIAADIAEPDGQGTGLPHLVKVQMLMARSKQDLDKTLLDGLVQEAKVTAAQVKDQKNLPSTLAAQIRAQCEDALGNTKEAAAMFEEAIAASPEDVTLLEAAARFYARNAHEPIYRNEAVKLLERFRSGELKRSDKEDVDLRVWARREIALILANSGTYAGFQEAVALSRENKTALEKAVETDASKKYDLAAELETLAQILASRELKTNLVEAVALLDQRNNLEPPPSLDIQFLRARLNLLLGRWTEASKLMANIVAAAKQSADRNPDRSNEAHARMAQYMSAYIDALLAHGDVDQAQGWIAVWRQSDPISFRATLAEARSLVPRPQPKTKAQDGDQKQPDETKPELKVAEALASLELGVSTPDLSAPEVQRRTLLAVLTMEDLLQIANEYGTPTDADLLKARIREYYQRILAADPKQAERRQLMQVRFLVLAGERQQAVELLKQHWQTAGSDTLVIACAALLNHADELKKLEQAGAEGKLTAEQVETKKKELLASVGEAERILQLALVKTQQELVAAAPNVDEGKVQEVTTLLSLLGGHYLASKRYDEAMQAYTQILALNPGHIVALNNRAMIMAATKTNLAEALTQVDSAIQRVGPLPLIVDSKAMVLYAAGQYIEALQAAQQVIAEMPDNLDPVRNPGLAKNWGGYYFHLAAIRDANGDKPGAAEAMKKATELGFGEADVSDLELGLWKEISGKVSG